jgi:type IV secretory pathway protease TraF
MGHARERDGLGRPLPAWHGCRVIADRDVFVMNLQSPDSLDGRYLGPLPASAVIGKAVPIWTNEE